MPDSHPPSGKLRVSGVAERYGLTERYVRHLVATRQIPFYKVGESAKAPLIFDQAELDNWFDQHRVEVV
jgi:excisionase family DNA binding protein